MEKYDTIDGTYKKDTDVIGLSVGRAQWDEDSFVPSVKVWRDTKLANGYFRVSRQSEETTLTRALDMATLVIKVIDAAEQKERPESFNSLQGEIRIDLVEKNKAMVHDLDGWIDRNKNDQMAHIAALEEAIERLHKHMP